MKTKRPSEKGVALVIALSAALVVFVIVTAVLNLTFNRFNLSFLQADHASAYYAAEAGIRYAFTRLEIDTTYSHTFPGCSSGNITGGLAQVVRHAQTHGTTHSPSRTFYIITSVQSPTNVTIDGTSYAPDDRTDELFMGSLTPSRVGRDVTLWIASGVNGVGMPEFRVRAFSEYGD